MRWTNNVNAVSMRQKTKLIIFDAYISLGFMLELSGHSREERVQQRSARAAARTGEEREKGKNTEGKPKIQGR